MLARKAEWPGGECVVGAASLEESRGSRFCVQEQGLGRAQEGALCAKGWGCPCPGRVSSQGQRGREDYQKEK